ncbi:hypothetical protein EV421DRAFT_1907967 [Armillaria borealis]|uniref:Uncharacterized protein n=1 Tax=Armillaria borealis TaxID=47425 RepID=A0AA39J6H1_9AGAR|nr:hypothetical protein EV421DRAFT_1907967 [Armillaria borealis]
MALSCINVYRSPNITLLKRHYYECTDLDNKDLLPFPIADAATICPLLTYCVEFWGYSHYWEMWPNLSVKPVMIRTICTQDLVVGGALAVLVSDNQKGETKPALTTNRKHVCSISFVEEMSTESKKPKLEHDSTHSSCPIVLPLVYSIAAKKLVQCEIFPMLSNEDDDRATIEGWNKCIVVNKDDTPKWYNTNRLRDSMICILDREAVRKGSRPSQLLQDFEVLMHDAPLQISWSWSLTSLNRVGDLDAPQEVQDHQKRMDPEKREDINVVMSFRGLFSEGQAENGRSLNVLNLPQAGQGVETIPYLWAFLVHKTAFYQTEDLLRDLFPQEFPKWVTTWSLVSTCDAITYIHSNSQGVGTAIRVLTGWKLWYIF